MLRMGSDEQYLSLVGLFTVRDGDIGRRAQAVGDPLTTFASAVAAAAPRNNVDRLLAIDTLTYLPGDLLVKMDIATMASSLEGRSPLLDHKLIEFVAHLPASMKVRGTTSKYLLRKLMRDQLPAAILTRRKMGFGVPVGRWMRGPMRDLVEDALLGMPPRPLIDRAQVAQITREHFDGRVDHAPRLWGLLMFELWFRYVVNDSPANIWQERAAPVPNG
jgi:asparagine synthase (glutamine-hydrolysing)